MHVLLFLMMSYPNEYSVLWSTLHNLRSYIKSLFYFELFALIQLAMPSNCRVKFIKNSPVEYHTMHVYIIAICIQ